MEPLVSSAANREHRSISSSYHLYSPLNNSTHSHSPNLSLPAAGESLSKFNQQSNKNNRLLNRLKIQLKNIKSQMFEMTKTHYSPSRQINSHRLQKSLDRSLNEEKIVSISPNESVVHDSSYHRYENQMLIKENLILKQKLSEKHQIFQKEKSMLVSKIVELEKQIVEKNQNYALYENEIQQQIARFKEQVTKNNNNQHLRTTIFQLESSILEMNNEVKYYKKRLYDDGQQIKKFTIQNHELKKQLDAILDKFKTQKNNKFEETELLQKIEILNQELQILKSSQYLYKKTSMEMEEVQKLRNKQSVMLEELSMQKKTIEVLQLQLTRALKQNKKIEEKNEQELQNAKMTYEKLLESVKEGLSQCYKTQIQDLRYQLLEVNGGIGSERVYEQNYHDCEPHPSRTETKLATEISSQIVIFEEDSALQQTQRKYTQKQDNLQNEANIVLTLKTRVQDLQSVIEGLEQEIQKLKWNRDSTYTPNQSRSVSKSLIALQTPAQLINADQNKNLELLEIAKNLKDQRNNLIYELQIKDYTKQLQDNVVETLLQDQLFQKQSIQNVGKELQLVIQRLRKKNHQTQKKVRNSEEIIISKNKLIDERQRFLSDIRDKLNEKCKENNGLLDRLQVLQRQKSNRTSLRDLDKQKSEQNYWKEVSEQVNQLSEYKIALEAELSKRESRMEALKEQINIMVIEQDKKNSYQNKDRRKSRIGSELQKQLEAQANHFSKIIKDLQDQIYMLRSQPRKRSSLQSSDHLSQIFYLRGELTKKNQQIHQIKNQIAVSRLRCDSLKSQHESQKSVWISQKKSIQGKYQKLINTLKRDLSLQKETVEFLNNRMECLQSQIAQRDQIIDKNFSQRKLIDRQNVPTGNKNDKRNNSFDMNRNSNLYICKEQKDHVRHQKPPKQVQYIYSKPKNVYN